MTADVAFVSVLLHAVSYGKDLPIPLWLAQYGAAAALLASFALLGRWWRNPRFTNAAHAGWPLPGWLAGTVDALGPRRLLAGVGLAAGLSLVVVAAAGPDNPAANPVSTWLYVWLWVGLIPISLLLGPVWRRLNPLRPLASVLDRLAGDSEPTAARQVPNRLGYWPAAAGLAAFAWLELVYENRLQARTVLAFTVVYALAQLGGASRYGAAWFDRGEAFEVYASLIARLSPFGRRADGRLVVRNPLASLAITPSGPGLTAVVCVLLGATAFDGITRSRWWSMLTAGASEPAHLLLGTAGLVGTVGLIGGTFLLAVGAAGRLATPVPDDTNQPLARRFAPSLLPIALGYAVAHYVSLLLHQGQAGYILASDPFGRGWDLFGTATWELNPQVLSRTSYAVVQVAAIVAGHVLGTIAAHDRATEVFKGDHALRAQLPLLALMVAYTIGGIALLLSP